MSERSATGPGAVLAPERFRNPAVGSDDAKRLAAEHWGVEAVEIDDVGSLQDRNFRLRDADGTEYALKIANAAVPRSALELEHTALRHLAAALDEVTVPRPLPVTRGSATAGPDGSAPPAASAYSASAAANGSAPLPATASSATDGPDGSTRLPATLDPGIVEVDGSAVRLMTWVHGVPMAALGRPTAADLEGLGAVTASVGVALADFEDSSRPSSQWDTRIAIEVVEAIEPRLGEDDRADLWRALGPLQEVRARLDGRLPRQWIHADVTDVNVVGGVDASDRFRVTGLIDFGDLVHTWRICDPAASIVAAIAAAPDDPLESALAVLRGYLSVGALEEVELDALWPTVLARAAVCLASSSLQDHESPGHDYVTATVESDRGALESVLSVHPALARAAIRDAAGLEPVSGAAEALQRLRTLDPAPIAPGLGPTHRNRGDLPSYSDGKSPRQVPPPRAVDLSVASAVLAEGAWLDPAGLAAAVHYDDGAIGVGRWAEVRLPYAGAPGPVPPSALHLGVDLFLPVGTPVAMPLAGEVVEVEADELTIALAGFESGPDLFLRLAGIEPTVAAGQTFERGAEFGRVLSPAVPFADHSEERNSWARGAGPDAGPPVSAAKNGAGPDVGLPAAAATNGASREVGSSSIASLPPHVHVQLGFAAGLPGLGDPRRRSAWMALCPDPSPLLGFDAAAPAPPDPATERARREAVLAGAQSLYYRAPMEIVRGWRATLIDSDARPYLDVVNNVAAVGHSHPGVTAAATEQLRLLNTNSRFLYDSLTEYAERIAALLPEELDRVFVVNSGSEALDLAVQLARVHTGRRDLAAIRGAYHGWTEAVFEACTSPQDNPGWEATKPAYVHVVDQPDPFRGVHGDDAGAYVDSVRAACAAATERGGLAAFLAEALLGNQGAVAPPPGYLAGAYEAVREAGGLCIADEVQVGLARTGTNFWAFEHEGVVPDIVAAAKATGNGHPVGFVACRAEIAESFGRRASFFSSTGGGPVSCRVGLAVLDAIADERLQERAVRVGGGLKRGLEELAARHPAIGAVNGRGLYLGVDIVVPGTRDPDSAEATAICERMRELGVIVQPTGDAYNLLKVKPPMCLGEDEADYFVAALDRVLGERERRAAAALDEPARGRAAGAAIDGGRR